MRSSGGELGGARRGLGGARLAYSAADLPKAEAVYRDVRQTCAAMDHLLGIATAETNLGNVLYDQGKLDEAVLALRSSEKLQRRSGRLENLPETLRLVALALHARGEGAAARAAAQEGLGLAERVGNSATIAAVREVVGRLG